MNVSPENVLAELLRIHDGLHLVRKELAEWQKDDFPLLGFDVVRVWHCVRALQGQDERFAADLEKQGYETYLPLTYSKIEFSDRSFAAVHLRFSPYVFVAVDYRRQNFHAITETLGYDDVLRFNVADVAGTRTMLPSVIPYDVILGMRQDEKEDLRAARYRIRRDESLYRIGDLVRVLREGQFKDKELPIKEIRSNAVILYADNWPLRLKETEIVPTEYGLLQRRTAERVAVENAAAEARAAAAAKKRSAAA